MAINFSCPISGHQRDGNAVRVVAGFSLLVALVAIATAYLAGAVPAAVIVGLLAIDFSIRAFLKPRFSPLAALARGLVSALDLPKKMVDSAPKIFAARIGVVFTVTSTILYAGGLLTAGTVVLVILAVCAFLESVFEFCLGCQVYSLLPRRVGDLLAHDFTRHSETS